MHYMYTNFPVLPIYVSLSIRYMYLFVRWICHGIDLALGRRCLVKLLIVGFHVKVRDYLTRAVIKTSGPSSFVGNRHRKANMVIMENNNF